ncbi:MAG TPA: TMEM175 family protein [Luteibacter sp.]|nr:TMEM175 family protein [Luteibacter sp.]
MSHAQDQQLERLTFFSDAVFAIAITLLVIEIHVPHPSANTDEAWLQALIDLTPHFFGFILSFIVIGALWAAHHRVFGLLRHYDPSIVWPNLFLLMAVAFMPFSSALMSTHSTERIPEVFYAATLLIAGLLQYRLIRKALRAPFLREDVSDETIAIMRRRSLAMPCMAVLAGALAFWWPGPSNLPLVLVPVVVMLFARSRKAATAPVETTS